MKPMNRQDGFITMIVVLILLILLGVGLVYWRVRQVNS